MITTTLASICKYNPGYDSQKLLLEALTPRWWDDGVIRFRRTTESNFDVDIILSQLIVDNSNVRIIVRFALDCVDLDCVDRVRHRTENRMPLEAVAIARRFLDGTASVDDLGTAVLAAVDATIEADATRAAAAAYADRAEADATRAAAAAYADRAEAAATSRNRTRCHSPRLSLRLYLGRHPWHPRPL